MAHAVLALGAAALTAAGNVWYLPALTDLRAGDDRPYSTRLAAAACLAWWLSVAVAGVLLLTSAGWQPPATVVLAGVVSSAMLRSMAVADRRTERQEAARRWASLRYDHPAPVTSRRRPHPAVFAWSAGGLAVASACVVLLSLHNAATGSVLATAAGGSTGIVMLALLLAARRARP